MNDSLRARIESELAYAARARAHTKEGRARVCARRAAGWAVDAYRRRLEPKSVWQRTALANLRWLRSAADQPLALQQAAARLTEQVREDHHLPHAEDPLQDARMIAEAFLGLLEDVSNNPGTNP